MMPRSYPGANADRGGRKSGSSSTSATTGTDTFRQRLNALQNGGSSSMGGDGVGSLGNDNLSGFPSVGMPSGLAASVNPFLNSAHMSEMTSLMYQQLVQQSLAANSAAPGGASSQTQTAGDLDYHQNPNSISQAEQRAQVQAERAAQAERVQAERAQAEREEELLLNLLISRRQRQMRAAESAAGQNNMHPNDSSANRQSLADQLLQLRTESTTQHETMGSAFSALDNLSNAHQETASNHHHLGSRSGSTLSSMSGSARNLAAASNNAVAAAAAMHSAAQQRHDSFGAMHSAQQRCRVDSDFNNAALGFDVLERVDRQFPGNRSGDVRNQDLQGMPPMHHRVGDTDSFAAKKRSFDAFKMGMAAGDNMKMGSPGRGGGVGGFMDSFSQQNLLDDETNNSLDFLTREMNAARHHLNNHGGYHQSHHHQFPLMQEPPKPKKRLHKKKPADMPRRPLSAYNLFFSEERERILREIEQEEEGKGDSASGGGTEKASADERDENEVGEKTTGGGENNSNDDTAEASADTGGERSKPKALLRPLVPSAKKRRKHRKTHGKISFQLLAQKVGQRWKELPSDKRKYYQDLAQEDMKRQKIAMEQYYKKQAEPTGDKAAAATTTTTTTKTTDAETETETAKATTTATASDNNNGSD